ncbi:MCP four helix bundle domain-containing protein [Dyadobacter sp. NIV53]|uniref:MCP four helix bundle domain-containing protein n=1 Tax=Dyadobacter sp. NIV53 TaxID=2861765 RepID=UPI001C87C651|nr:MCP four helix bundle domain-containing protein [Dyadobacter sp. NIV53]
MKIKTKLRLGIGLLFIMILVLSAVGVCNMNALSSDTENILADNYNTLEYCKNMIAALDAIQQKQSGFDDLEKNLDLQKKNITEPGEGLATEHISSLVPALKINQHDINQHLLIRKDISKIMELNMAAIKHKSDIARSTAEKANQWIVIASTLCLLLGMTLFINLPGNIVPEPVRDPSSIKRI